MLKGEFIPKPKGGSGEPPYAQVLEAGISGPDSGLYPLTIRARIKILRTVLKRDQVDLSIQAKLGYDAAKQLLTVTKFRLDALTRSSFYNASLELLANKVAYSQILKKARIPVGEIILKEQEKINRLLEEGLELKGLKLNGGLEVAAVKEVNFLPEKVLVLVEVQGNLEAEIIDLASLLPPQQQQT